MMPNSSCSTTRVATWMSLHITYLPRARISRAVSARRVGGAERTSSAGGCARKGERKREGGGGVPSEAVLCGVCLADDVGLRLERNQRHDRPEDLLRRAPPKSRDVQRGPACNMQHATCNMQQPRALHARHAAQDVCHGCALRAMWHGMISTLHDILLRTVARTGPVCHSGQEPHVVGDVRDDRRREEEPAHAHAHAHAHAQPPRTHASSAPSAVPRHRQRPRGRRGKRLAAANTGDAGKWERSRLQRVQVGAELAEAVGLCTLSRTRRRGAARRRRAPAEHSSAAHGVLRGAEWDGTGRGCSRAYGRVRAHLCARVCMRVCMRVCVCVCA
jgi:hypothetical protein